MRYHSVLQPDGSTKEVEFTPSEEAETDALRAAHIADTPRREAQSILVKWDTKGFTRAWETSVAALVAAETLPEYDQTIFDEKKAARAVVVG